MATFTPGTWARLLSLVRVAVAALRPRGQDAARPAPFDWLGSNHPLVVALRWLAIVALLVLFFAVHRIEAQPAQAPACDPARPQPPLIVVLPDGSEVPAASVRYDPPSRMVWVTQHDGIFCSGFEGSPG